MAKLTEDMVTARARGAVITTLKKLNCWGSSLTDVSLLQQMPNLEVIAFSVNQISSLADFTKCVKLQELYLRGNQISDFNQVVYLQELPSLRQLWLKENPIENAPYYRETVIRALPNLHRLDDSVIDQSEVDHAMRFGRELCHPALESINGSPSKPGSTNSSRTPSPLQQRDTMQEYEGDEQAETVPLNDDQDDDYEPLPSSYSSSRKNFEYDAEPVSSPQQEEEPIVLVSPSASAAPRLSIGSGIIHRSPRPPIRSANILSSVLLLIKELDVVSLEVIHVAVQSRINELLES